MAAATAIPRRNSTCSANRPSTAMQTVSPAKNTARPDVFTAIATASSEAMPACTFCR